MGNPWYEPAKITIHQASYRPLGSSYDTVPVSLFDNLSNNLNPTSDNPLEITKNHLLKRITQYQEYDLSFKLKINSLNNRNVYRNIFHITRRNQNMDRFPAMWYHINTDFQLNIQNQGEERSQSTKGAPEKVIRIDPNFQVGETHKIRLVAFYDVKGVRDHGILLIFIDDVLWPQSNTRQYFKIPMNNKPGRLAYFYTSGPWSQKAATGTQIFDIKYSRVTEKMKFDELQYFYLNDNDNNGVNSVIKPDTPLPWVFDQPFRKVTLLQGPFELSFNIKIHHVKSDTSQKCIFYIGEGESRFDRQPAILLKRENANSDQLILHVKYHIFGRNNWDGGNLGPTSLRVPWTIGTGQIHSMKIQVKLKNVSQHEKKFYMFIYVDDELMDETDVDSIINVKTEEVGLYSGHHYGGGADQFTADYYNIVYRKIENFDLLDIEKEGSTGSDRSSLQFSSVEQFDNPACYTCGKVINYLN